MILFLIKIKNLVFDVLFPLICLDCQKYIANGENPICNQCFSLIKLNTSLFCPVCRARLADNKKICNHGKKNQPFSYLLAAAGNYDDPILRNLIHYFKYESFENLSPLLGELTIKYIENCKLKIENYIVIPVPLSSRSLRRRGFNQSKSLAEFIAANFNLTMINGLKRTKNTLPQAKLKDNEERAKNVKNCFTVQNAENIKNKNILLVDDVFTSGATMNEAVRILKENGARRIIALVLAKA